MDVNAKLVCEHSPWFKTHILVSVGLFTKPATFCDPNVIITTCGYYLYVYFHDRVIPLHCTAMHCSDTPSF